MPDSYTPLKNTAAALRLPPGRAATCKTKSDHNDQKLDSHRYDIRKCLLMVWQGNAASSLPDAKTNAHFCNLLTTRGGQLLTMRAVCNVQELVA